MIMEKIRTVHISVYLSTTNHCQIIIMRTIAKLQNHWKRTETKPWQGRLVAFFAHTPRYLCDECKCTLLYCQTFFFCVCVDVFCIMSVMCNDLCI